MNLRGATLPLTAWMIVTSLGGAEAQRLFPVQSFEPPKAPQPPAQQADPATPSPPALLLETVRNLANRKPRIVCGMTLVPANPSIDSKMAQKKNPEKTKDPTTYTIRPVQPSLCW